MRITAKTTAALLLLSVTLGALGSRYFSANRGPTPSNGDSPLSTQTTLQPSSEPHATPPEDCLKLLQEILRPFLLQPRTAALLTPTLVSGVCESSGVTLETLRSETPALLIDQLKWSRKPDSWKTHLEITSDSGDAQIDIDRIGPEEWKAEWRTNPFPSQAIPAIEANFFPPLRFKFETQGHLDLSPSHPGGFRGEADVNLYEFTFNSKFRAPAGKLKIELRDYRVILASGAQLGSDINSEPVLDLFAPKDLHPFFLTLNGELLLPHAPHGQPGWSLRGRLRLPKNRSIEELGLPAELRQGYREALGATFFSIKGPLERPEWKPLK